MGGESPYKRKLCIQLRQLIGVRIDSELPAYNNQKLATVRSLAAEIVTQYKARRDYAKKTSAVYPCAT